MGQTTGPMTRMGNALITESYADGDRVVGVTDAGVIALSQVERGDYSWSSSAGHLGGFVYGDGRLITVADLETLVCLWELLHHGYLVVQQKPGGYEVRLTRAGRDALVRRG